MGDQPPGRYEPVEADAGISAQYSEPVRTKGATTAVAAAGVAAIAAALLAVLILREPIATAAVAIDAVTGKVVSSAVSAGYRYPPPGQVTLLAILAGSLTGLIVLLWTRRSALMAAARRRLRPADLLSGDDDVAGKLLDDAVMERLN